MTEGTIDGTPYPIAIGDRGQTLWETVSVAAERDIVWEDWSQGIGETKRRTGRGYLWANGFDGSIEGALKPSPFYHNLNNTALTTEYGYFMESVETTGSTLTLDAYSGGSDTSTTSLSFNHTVGSGSDRILIIGFTASTKTITNVSYDLLELTLLEGGSEFTQLWYLLSPPVGTAAIIVSATSSSDISAGGISLNGANQDAPFGTLVSAGGESTSPSVTVTTSAGEFVVDVVGAAANVTATAGANQTRRWHELANTSRAAGSTQAGSDGGVMSWTLSSSAIWRVVAVPVKPASTTSRSVMQIADTTKIFRYSYDSATGLSLDATDTTASGVAGRPAKVNGNWYVGMGSGASAQKLTGATWADVTGTWKANHLATYQKGITPNLVRVDEDNPHKISFNVDTGNITDTWSGSTAVGDSTTKITDIAEAQGILLVAKEDNLYDFGLEAESRPILSSKNKGKVDADNGKYLMVDGDEVAYPSRDNLWRYRINSGAIPVGINSLRWRLPKSPLNLPRDGRHVAVVAAGDYWYALLNHGLSSYLMQSRKRETVGSERTWHSVLKIPLCKGMAVDSLNRLWLKGASLIESQRDIMVVELAEDGGLDVADRKGRASTTSIIYLDEVNPGRPQDKVQIRHISVITEGDWDATTSLTLNAYLDADIGYSAFGSAITTEGLSRASPGAVGTNDQAYRFRVTLVLVLNSSYTPLNSDPTILYVIAGIYFPEIIRIVIPAQDTPGITIKDMEKNLRRLQNRGVVEFQRPDEISTFSAEITSVTDTLYATKDGFAHGLEITAKRWATS